MNPNEDLDEKFWQDVEAAPPPPDGDQFEALPLDLWYIGRTATEQDNAWAPKAIEQKGKGPNEGRVFYKFEVGLAVMGGEAKVEANLAKRWQRWEAFTLPGEREDHKLQMGGRLMGFLNAVFATGVAAGMTDSREKAAARFKATIAKIKASAPNYPDIAPGPFMTLMRDMPQWGQGLYLAAIAAAMLKQDGHLVLFKTKLGKKVEGQEQRTNAGAEEYTAESAAKRRVRLFDGTDTPSAGAEAF